MTQPSATALNIAQEIVGLHMCIDPTMLQDTIRDIAAIIDAGLAEVREALVDLVPAFETLWTVAHRQKSKNETLEAAKTALSKLQQGAVPS